MTNNFLTKYCILSFLLLALVSCKKQSPQLPSNKVQEPDSVELKLRNYNKKLIQNEDSAIVQFLATQKLEFTKTDSGLWFHFEKKSQLKALRYESMATFSYKAFSLDGNLLLLEENQKVLFGKKQIPKGLEEALKLMKKEEVAQFIAPSYLAYGTQGNERIAPYTTIIYFIETK